VCVYVCAFVCVRVPRVDPAHAGLYRARVGQAFTECVRIGVLRTLAPLGACDAVSAADKEALAAMCPALYRPTPAAALGAGACCGVRVGAKHECARQHRPRCATRRRRTRARAWPWPRRFTRSHPRTARRVGWARPTHANVHTPRLPAFLPPPSHQWAVMHAGEHGFAVVAPPPFYPGPCTFCPAPSWPSVRCACLCAGAGGGAGSGSGSGSASPVPGTPTGSSVSGHSGGTASPAPPSLKRGRDAMEADSGPAPPPDRSKPQLRLDTVASSALARLSGAADGGAALGPLSRANVPRLSAWLRPRDAPHAATPGAPACL
jgi:hypothetical protein